MRFENASIGTGLLLGRSNAKLSLGVNYTIIKAKYKAGKMPTAQAAGFSDAHAYDDPYAMAASEQDVEDKNYIHETRNTSYSGVTPTIGIRLYSAANNFFLIEFGRFIPAGDAFDNDLKGIFRQTSIPLTKNGGRTTFNIGMGLGF